MDNVKRYTIRLNSELENYIVTEAKKRNILPSSMIKCILTDYKEGYAYGNNEREWK